MTSASRVSRGIVGTIAAIALFATPAAAFAGSASVITKQVIPQGGAGCAPLFVQSVTPYIYDGELHAFDVVISDPSYVGLLGAAGDAMIPFNYMSRHMNPDGSLRLQIVTTADINGNLPVTITMLSALPNAPVCLAQVSFTVDEQGTIEGSSPISVPNTPVEPKPDNTVGGGTGSGNGGTSGGTSGGSNGGAAGGTNGGTVVPPVGTTSGTSTVGALVAKMCSENGAYQLWFILLAIFFVIAAFVGLSEPALALRHGALPAALIGVPLIGLLLFWLFATDCRLSYFIPVILLVAAAIGLYSAYRTSPVTSPVIVLPAEKKTTVTKTEETRTDNK